MIKIETIGTVIEVANVIQELMTHMEVLVIGDGSEEVCESVFNTLKDFKVAFSKVKTEEGQLIKIYD
jgi:hypothetical protein